MARYRSDIDDERDFYDREERTRRDPGLRTDYSYGDRRGYENESRGDLYSSGRYGERAEYDRNEPRYSDPRERIRDEGRRTPPFESRGDFAQRSSRPQYPHRSRVRCRDIMTRDLVIATRDTPISEVARMMKQEDTGVIPVVEYDTGNGNGATRADGRTNDGRVNSRGKLVGLITDRDIVIRAVSESHDCSTTRAEQVMSTDIYTVRPNDRVVDAIRTMGNKQVRRIPAVNENGYLMGMISMADIANETHDDVELTEALEDISRGSSFWNRIFG